jgi:outer membrane protein assembly factor BamA
VNALFPIYIGQMGLVRGYDFIFDANPAGEFGDIGFSQLLGTSFGLASFEVRLPFTGPKQLALIGSKVFFTDLALFFDAGMAFNEFGDIGSESPNAPELAMSVGASVRFNLFGAMILEPYWAYPLQQNSRVVFGMNFIPGW